MVGEASGRMQKADCRDEIALPAAMLAWLKYRKQRTRNSRKRFLVFFFLWGYEPRRGLEESETNKPPAMRVRIEG